MKWPLFLCHILHLGSIRPVSSFYYDYFLHSDRISNQESSDMHNILCCNLHVYYILSADYVMQYCCIVYLDIPAFNTYFLDLKTNH